MKEFGRDEEALVFINKVLDLDSDNIEAYILKATLLNNLGYSDELFGLMQSLYPRFKKEERILCLAASYAGLFQNVRQANYFLKKALKLNRPAVIQNEMFYQALLSADRKNDIINFTNEALEVWKENPAVWDAFARTSAALKEYETADKAFSILSRLIDLTEDLCEQWMDVSLQLQKYDQAFDLLLEMYSDSVEWLIRLYEFFQIMKQDGLEEQCREQAEFLASRKNKTPEIQFICDMILENERNDDVPLLMTQLINDENALEEDSVSDSSGSSSLLEQMLVSLQVPAKESLNVLDLGCGTGALASVLEKYSLPEGNLIGVDVSSVSLDVAFEEGGYTDLQETDLISFCKAKANAKQYDLIVCMNVLSYFSDLAPVFKAVKAALKPDGFFVFSVHPLTETDQKFVFRKDDFFWHNPEYVTACLKKARLQEEDRLEGDVHKVGEEDTPCLIFAVQKKK